MIQSFRDRGTNDVFHGVKSRAASKVCPATLWRVARRKLDQLNQAHVLQDLGVPPGNKLEALKGDRKGEHSIRINKQYRACFRWTPAGPGDVQIVDYHA
ncbi:MAG: type II toxin-antitoxin system RelE/ParE family toxin [Gemmatimonadota bacterium]